MFQLFVLPIVAILFSSCSSVRADRIKTPTTNNISLVSENTLLLLAMDYESRNFREGSAELFLHLFQKTNKPEYATEYLKTLEKLSKYKIIIQKFKELNLSGDENREILAKAHYRIHNNNQAKDIFLTLKKDLNEDSNLFLALIYLEEGKTDKGIKLLQNRLDSSEKFQLFTSRALAKIYMLNKQYQKSLELYKKIYKKYPVADTMFDIEMIYQKLDKLDDFFIFAEQNSFDDNYLLDLYVEKRLFPKALKLINKMILQNPKDIELQVKSIVLQEKIYSENNQTSSKYMIPLIKKLETLISVNSDNAFNLNYLGYFMLEQNYQIETGIEYIQQAVKIKPDDMMILDSLAYGQFLLGDCENALKNMSKVIDKLGLKEIEISEHWEKIKLCKERK